MYDKTLQVNVQVDIDDIRKKIETLIKEVEPAVTASEVAWKVREAFLNGSNYEFFLLPENSYGMFCKFLDKFFYMKDFEVRRHPSITREGYVLVEVYM